MSVQKNNVIQYTMQDQLYLPRLTNYLNIEQGAYEWENKALFELSKEEVQHYDAVAVTALTQKYLEQLLEWNPDITVIRISQEQFMRSFASRGFVMGMTSGYVLVDPPSVTMQGTPAMGTLNPYTDKELRKLMRAYPSIYWEVSSFERVKERLSEKTTDITIALTPAALAYKKYFSSTFPEVPVIETKEIIDPLDTFGSSRKNELTMIAIGLVTAFLLTLLVLFQ